MGVKWVFNPDRPIEGLRPGASAPPSPDERTIDARIRDDAHRFRPTVVNFYEEEDYGPPSSYTETETHSRINRALRAAMRLCRDGEEI